MGFFSRLFILPASCSWTGSSWRCNITNLLFFNHDQLCSWVHKKLNNHNIGAKEVLIIFNDKCKATFVQLWPNFSCFLGFLFLAKVKVWTIFCPEKQFCRKTRFVAKINWVDVDANEINAFRSIFWCVA